MIIKKLSIVLLVSIVCINSTFATQDGGIVPQHYGYTSGSMVQKNYNNPYGNRPESDIAADREKRKAKRKKMLAKREAQSQINSTQSAPAVLS